MKYRTASQLIDSLDAELSWRQREIIVLREIASSARDIKRDALVRSYIPILYAHWEGFVKIAAEAFCLFLSSRNLTYLDIKDSFLGIKALYYVQQLHEIRKNVFVASNVTKAILKLTDERVEINFRKHLGNVGNLSFDTFMQIVEFLSLNKTIFQMKDKLIDEELVKLRNEIAHGQYLYVDWIGVQQLSDEGYAIMRAFKDEIQNSAVLESYRR
jgi:hypothetical protein